MGNRTQPVVETWLPVAGFKDRYEVSSLGRVRSKDMRVGAGPNGGTKLHKGRVLKQYVDQGYARVCLTVDQKVYSRTVHRLVATAFLGPLPDGLHTCHNNGISLDNRAENLRYDTPSENSRDVVRHGNHHEANRTHCKRGHELTEDNIYREPGKRARKCRTCRRLSARANNKKRRQER